MIVDVELVEELCKDGLRLSFVKLLVFERYVNTGLNRDIELGNLIGGEEQDAYEC